MKTNKPCSRFPVRRAVPRAAVGWLACLCAVGGLLALPRPASAGPALSELSELSLLPVAVSLTAPAFVLVAGAGLTVVAVEGSVKGSVWVLERASDGARSSIRFAGRASVAVGTVITVTALGSGQVLSAAGEVLAFVPNAVGASLLHNEQLTR